jgi:hypothetical protein
MLSASALLVCACAAKPTVVSHKTMMTPRQIADLGLACKLLRPIDSNIPRTICASEASWDSYLAMTVRATEDFMAEGRRH